MPSWFSLLIGSPAKVTISALTAMVASQAPGISPIFSQV